MGQLHDPCQEPGEVAEAVAAGQIAGLGVGDQIVIDQRELVPEGSKRCHHGSFWAASS
jgi:hypothetical protein